MIIRLLLELLRLALMEQERQRFVDGIVDGLEPSLPFPDPDKNAEFVLGHVDGLRGWTSVEEQTHSCLFCGSRDTVHIGKWGDFHS